MWIEGQQSRSLRFQIGNAQFEATHNNFISIHAHTKKERKGKEKQKGKWPRDIFMAKHNKQLSTILIVGFSPG